MKLKLMVLLILGIWLGMVLGISFLEAPLKFRAPNMTLTLGLGIGKLVFGALNKIELIFSVILLGWLAFQYKSLAFSATAPLLLLLVIVLIQSFWLLPILDARIDNLLLGIEVAKTNHHFYYVGFEVVKAIVLALSFVKIYHHE